MPSSASGPSPDPNDTGSTAGDLQAFVEQFANPSDPNYACQCSQVTRDHLTTIVDRGSAHGGLPPDIDETMDRVIAPIMYRILFDRQEVTAGYCRKLLRQTGRGGRLRLSLLRAAGSGPRDLSGAGGW